jgi:hypothetical protein
VPAARAARSATRSAGSWRPAPVRGRREGRNQPMYIGIGTIVIIVIIVLVILLLRRRI